MWIDNWRWVQFLAYLALAALIALLLRLFAANFHLLFYLLEYLSIQFSVARFVRSGRTIADVFEERARDSASSVAIVSAQGTMTYGDLERRSALFARWAITKNFSSGDVVALMMENREDFIALWLAFARIGVCCALLNTGLRGASFLHCVRVSQAKALIFSSECLEQVEQVKDHLQRCLSLYYYNSDNTSATQPYHSLLSDVAHLQSAMRETCSSVEFEQIDFRILYRKGLDHSSLLFLIYTSGTTGLPKACRIRNSRFYLAGVSFSTFFHVEPHDRIYISVPLFHSVGNIVAISMAWHVGCSIALRNHFSASKFWKDCCTLEASCVVYVGQLCKYLLNTEPSEFDTAHRVKKAIGNGMPAECWTLFQERFQVPEVCEFYASSEGNCNLVNNRNRVGSIGYIPWIASFIYPIRVIQFDVELEQHVKNSSGYCIDAKQGELIGRLANDPLRAFDGYTDHSSSQAKIMRSVFSKDDSWFRTGDIVRIDSEGFLYFVDRIGESYRWKEENVSTTEVESVIGLSNLFAEANVYGVRVPGYSGRCGMACIVAHVPGTRLRCDQLQALYQVVTQHLPVYARPCFLRVSAHMDVTSTFKQKKVDLVREGFDPSSVTDDLFFKDDNAKTYISLDSALYSRIVSNELRL